MVWDFFLSPHGSADVLIGDAGLLLLIQSVNWSVFICASGLVQRAIVPYGYYPRNAWWYVGGSFISTISAAIAVLMGAGFFLTGVVQALSYALFSLVLHWNLWSILRRESILPVRPQFWLGVQAIWPSLVLAAKTLLNMVQQHGIRILLAGFLGLRELAAFATMRTVSNVALQGIGVVVNPMTPELMRFAGERDCEKVQASFGLIWIVAVFGMGLGLVFLQTISPWLFEIWTLGKIEFNPTVFATLSAALLVFGLSQPFVALVRGNNLLKPQIFVTILGAILTVGTIYIFTHRLSMLAAALGLLVAEISGLLVYGFVAHRWMNANGLQFPNEIVVLATAMALTNTTAIYVIALNPKIGLLIVISTLFLTLCFMWRVWLALPRIAQVRAAKILMIFNKLF